MLCRYPRACALIGIGLTLAALNQLLPPDLSRAQSISRTVIAADNTPLRTYLTVDGMVRYQADVAQVSPRYIDLLIAYEDQRFYRHAGVDGFALARAGVQALRSGHVISGGSTLTMQVARLLEPRPRTVAAKVIEILRATQLELRFSKREILALYLTLAPMGGNLEGVDAAASQYFNKPAAELSLADAATLIALPQSPTKLRRATSALRLARNKILRTAAIRAGYRAADVAAAVASPVGLRFRSTAFSAPQLADRRLAQAPPGQVRIPTTLNGPWQRSLERNTARWRQSLDTQASLAILVVDSHTRAARAYVATADFTSRTRDGQVDMVTAIRSPGSALKPFIYARAFDQGLAHPMTLVDDVETRFGSYAPANFQDQYHGRVTLSDALRLSLNVPAVLLLDRLGPVAFTEAMRREGLPLVLPKGVQPGLPVALGGVGVTLEQLCAAYAALADDGRIRPIRLDPSAPAAAAPEPFAGEGARAVVRAILRTSIPPDGVANHAARTLAIGLKTGTSYGYRDAWAFGFDGRHVVGVWTGRPDGTPSPGRFGVNTAAPILYDVFDLIGVTPPDTSAREAATAVPAALAALAPGPAGTAQRSLKIAFPIDGAIVPYLPGKAIPLEVRGGKSPFMWVANGALVGSATPGQSLMWVPDGPGFQTLTVVDATGRAASVALRISETAGFVP